MTDMTTSSQPRSRRVIPGEEDASFASKPPQSPVVSFIEDNKKLRLKPIQWFVQRGVHLPSSLYRYGNTQLFHPQAFSIGNNETGYLKEKIIESRYQLAGASEFLAEPKLPEVYGVSSEPDNFKALFYSAYLVQCFLERCPNSRVKWLPLYSIMQEKDFFKDTMTCDLLVVPGLYLNSIPFRLEIMRDVLAHYDHIPIIVPIGGIDALTMFKAHLHSDLHKFAHFDSSLVRKTVEIV